MMDKNQIIHYLSSIELFRDVEAAQLERLLADSYTIPFERDEYLFFQEDPANIFYVLVQGRIKLSQLTTDGDQVTLHYLNPGEAFGIIAVLREIHYPVTAQAIEAGECIAWNEEVIKKWIVLYPQIALNSIRILSNFILSFQDRIRELSTERVERRIARALLRLAYQGGEKTNSGISLGFKLTREDIANMAGTTLYTVSRTLSKWESQGVIDCQRNAITIVRPHQLTQVAEDSKTDTTEI